MTLSSGIPRRRGLGGISRIIRSRQRRVTVQRPTETQGSLDETQTDTNEHTESLWLFEPRENVGKELAGKQVDGSLGGLAAADGSVDVALNDRIVYGGVKYEVDTVVGHPDDADADGTPSPDTDFWVISFVRRQ
jgi:hypothetical protein